MQYIHIQFWGPLWVFGYQDNKVNKHHDKVPSDIDEDEDDGEKEDQPHPKSQTPALLTIMQ